MKLSICLIPLNIPSFVPDTVCILCEMDWTSAFMKCVWLTGEGHYTNTTYLSSWSVRYTVEDHKFLNSNWEEAPNLDVE